MASIKKNIRIQEGLYEESTEVFQKLGINMAMGINILFSYIHRTGAIPSELPLRPTKRAASVTRAFNFDETLFQEVKEIVEKLGFTLPQVVYIYLCAVCEYQGIPFELRLTGNSLSSGE